MFKIGHRTGTLRRVVVVCLLGFSSGLPLALSGATLQAWFTVSGVDLLTIGFLSLAGLPYIYKFLWAPVMDRFIPPLGGRRRGWIWITQLALTGLIAAFSLFDPTVSPLLLGGLALAIAFCSASQDIAIDAYQTDVLKPEERGLGAAMYAGGYRIAMLVSGGVALILADYLGWRETFLIMSGFMSIGAIAAWYGEEPNLAHDRPERLSHAIVRPFQEFLSREGAWAILCFIILYKLGDAFAVSLSSTFLLRGLGFTLTQVGIINKFMSLAGSLSGILLGGLILTRCSLFSSLIGFGVLQGFSNLFFMALAIIGKNIVFASFAVFIENFCGGMGTAAFIALLMRLCDTRYTATQFALLSALASIGRVVVGPLAAVMVAHMGWVTFYFWTFVPASPHAVVTSAVGQSPRP